MSVTAVLGAQWGDEGKGKIVDYLAASADMVIRFQGGRKRVRRVQAPSGSVRNIQYIHDVSGRHGSGGQSDLPAS